MVTNMVEELGDGAGQPLEKQQGVKSSRTRPGRPCRKCKNHGQLAVVTQDHIKSFCPYLSCPCLLCRTTDKKRVEAREYWTRKKTVRDVQASSQQQEVGRDSGPGGAGGGRRVQETGGDGEAEQLDVSRQPARPRQAKCSGELRRRQLRYDHASCGPVYNRLCKKCMNHDRFEYGSSGHAESCAFRECACPPCRTADSQRHKRRMTYQKRRCLIAKRRLVTPQRAMLCARCNNHGLHVTWDHRHGKPCLQETCACAGCPSTQKPRCSEAEVGVEGAEATAEELAPPAPRNRNLCTACSGHYGTAGAACRYLDCRCVKCVSVSKKSLLSELYSSKIGYIPLIDASVPDNDPDGPKDAEQAEFRSEDSAHAVGGVGIALKKKRFPRATYPLRKAGRRVKTPSVPILTEDCKPKLEPPSEDQYEDQKGADTATITALKPSSEDLYEDHKSPNTATITANIQNDSDETGKDISECLRQWAERVLVAFGVRSANGKLETSQTAVPDGRGAPKPAMSTKSMKAVAMSPPGTASPGLIALFQDVQDPEPQCVESSARPFQVGLRMCVECDESFETEELMDKHDCAARVAAVDAEAEACFCHVCRSKLSSRTQLAAHRIAQHAHAWDAPPAPGAAPVPVQPEDGLLSTERLMHLFTLLRDVSLLADDVLWEAPTATGM